MDIEIGMGRTARRAYGLDEVAIVQLVARTMNVPV